MKIRCSVVKPGQGQADLSGTQHIRILKCLSKHCFLPRNTGSHLDAVLRNGVSNTPMADRGAVKMP